MNFRQKYEKITGKLLINNTNSKERMSKFPEVSSKNRHYALKIPNIKFHLHNTANSIKSYQFHARNNSKDKFEAEEFSKILRSPQQFFLKVKSQNNF